ncbi:GRF1-INTERACTING FACTOR family protein [Salix suchowensis]|nr:GRF1-INTERACTING FACTOR family protein [Salix suchowensis]
MYLDENKRLILAIWDNQNLGKLAAECARAHYKYNARSSILELDGSPGEMEESHRIKTYTGSEFTTYTSNASSDAITVQCCTSNAGSSAVAPARPNGNAMALRMQIDVAS